MQKVTDCLFYLMYYRDTSVIACLDGKENFVKRSQMNVIQSLVETMAPAQTFSTAIGKRFTSSLHGHVPGRPGLCIQPLLCFPALERNVITQMGKRLVSWIQCFTVLSCEASRYN